LISAPAVGVFERDVSAGLATGRAGVGLTTEVGSTISGGFAAGGTSATRAFGFAISWTARPAIVVRPPRFGPSAPPSEIVIVARSSAVRERHSEGVSPDGGDDQDVRADRQQQRAAEALLEPRPLVQNRAHGLLH
jgi:hypothetical protein